MIETRGDKIIINFNWLQFKREERISLLVCRFRKSSEIVAIKAALFSLLWTNGISIVLNALTDSIYVLLLFTFHFQTYVSLILVQLNWYYGTKEIIEVIFNLQLFHNFPLPKKNLIAPSMLDIGYENTLDIGLPLHLFPLCHNSIGYPFFPRIIIFCLCTLCNINRTRNFYSWEKIKKKKHCSSLHQFSSHDQESIMKDCKHTLQRHLIVSLNRLIFETKTPN